MKLWKSFKSNLKNDNGDIKWRVGEWFHQEGDIKCCKNGFHASVFPLDAMRYINCEILARVSVKGESHKENDKQAWSDMKIDRAYYWKKEDSVALSIHAAELCIKNFEKVFPDDKRPREAIQATKDWLKCPCKKHKESAWSAARSAARSAWSAWSAARSAESAWSAARSAESAAWSAARSARSAWSAARSAESAWSAARSAARSAAWSAARSAESAWSAARSAESAAYEKTWSKLNKWVEKRISKLEEYDI